MLQALRHHANTLKLIAIIAMTIDHIADLLYPGMPNNIIPNICHIIGRLTAPIMFFFICEGYFYTKDVKKYIKRLFSIIITKILRRYCCLNIKCMKSFFFVYSRLKLSIILNKIGS